MVRTVKGKKKVPLKNQVKVVKQNWTMQHTNKVLNRLLKKLREDTKYKHISLESLLEDEPFTRFSFYHGCQKYCDENLPTFDFDIAEKTVKIKEILQSRWIDGASHFKLQPTFAMFVLKCNYGFQEYTNININDGKDKPLDDATKTLLEMALKLKEQNNESDGAEFRNIPEDTDSAE